VTAGSVEAELTRVYAWREAKVLERLTPTPTAPPGPG
jgi:hypothetical protein